MAVMPANDSNIETINFFENMDLPGLNDLNFVGRAWMLHSIATQRMISKLGVAGNGKPWFQLFIT
jgi:hypothetical protein